MPLWQQINVNPNPIPIEKASIEGVVSHSIWVGLALVGMQYLLGGLGDKAGK